MFPLAVERAVQVVAGLRIPEVHLHPPGPEQRGVAVQRGAVEGADRHLDLVELSPVGGAVGAPLEDEGVAVLDTVGEDGPVVRVERPVQVGAVARRQEPPHPDVELVRHLELRDGVQDLEVGVLAVRCAERPPVVDVGVHHELDVAGDRPVHVQTQAVDPEVVGRVLAVRVAVDEAALQPRADRDRRQVRLLVLGLDGPDRRDRAGERRQQGGRQSAPPPPRDVVVMLSVTTQQCPPDACSPRGLLDRRRPRAWRRTQARGVPTCRGDSVQARKMAPRGRCDTRDDRGRVEERGHAAPAIDRNVCLLCLVLTIM